MKYIDNVYKLIDMLNAMCFELGFVSEREKTCSFFKQSYLTIHFEPMPEGNIYEL